MSVRATAPVISRFTYFPAAHGLQVGVANASAADMVVPSLQKIFLHEVWAASSW
jgi:hypothetical protein